jgi:hypothetical protein
VENLRDFCEYRANVLINLQLKRIFPEEVFHIDILKLLMFPESTEFAYLQRETTFLGFFCVVTRGAAEADFGSGRTGAGIVRWSVQQA